MLDFITGQEISVAEFYILPVAIAAWWSNCRTAYLVAAVAALAWYEADLLAGHIYSHPAIGWWNGFSRFLLFAMILYLVRVIRRRFDDERARADTDPLTGLLNKRGFQARAERELLRARRFGQPFSVVFIDLDNFKQVNDTKGHAEGDRVLRRVASGMLGNLRETDLVARVGGDEFVALFAEAAGKGADAMVEALRARLLQAMEMVESGVTFSIGLVTFESPPENVHAMLQLADRVMYEAKNSGKTPCAP